MLFIFSYLFVKVRSAPVSLRLIKEKLRLWPRRRIVWTETASLLTAQKRLEIEVEIDRTALAAEMNNNANGALHLGVIGNGTIENGEGKEKGEIGEILNSKTETVGGEADMELEPPQPKEDPMVDYTDEFGRVRTMRQR